MATTTETATVFAIDELPTEVVVYAYRTLAPGSTGLNDTDCLYRLPTSPAWTFANGIAIARRDRLDAQALHRPDTLANVSALLMPHGYYQGYGDVQGTTAEGRRNLTAEEKAWFLAATKVQ